MSDEGQQVTVEIDKNNLDKECIHLPNDYVVAARQAADVRLDMDEKKAFLDVVQAQLAKEIRADPESFEIEKLTEAALSSTILLQPRYQKALASFQKAKHDYDLIQALVWALEHKKRSLTLLVELHGLGYFSDVKVSEKGREAVNEMLRKKIHKKFRDDE